MDRPTRTGKKISNKKLRSKQTLQFNGYANIFELANSTLSIQNIFVYRQRKNGSLRQEVVCKVTILNMQVVTMQMKLPGGQITQVEGQVLLSL